MKKGFQRRIYTFRLLISDLKYLMLRLSSVRKAMKDSQPGKIFTEKIMTVVTAVNACPYCAWFHARQSVACGIKEDELKQILNLQFRTSSTDYELPGLLFAQHYAETKGNPDREMINSLYQFYGEKQASNIIILIRVITFGNLSGNTFDAFLSRIKGRKAENSNLFFELFFFLFSFPFLLPLLPFSAKYRK